MVQIFKTGYLPICQSSAEWAQFCHDWEVEIALQMFGIWIFLGLIELWSKLIDMIVKHGEPFASRKTMDTTDEEAIIVGEKKSSENLPQAKAETTWKQLVLKFFIQILGFPLIMIMLLGVANPGTRTRDPGF